MLSWAMKRNMKINVTRTDLEGLFGTLKHMGLVWALLLQVVHALIDFHEIQHKQ